MSFTVRLQAAEAQPGRVHYYLRESGGGRWCCGREMTPAPPLMHLP